MSLNDVNVCLVRTIDEAAECARWLSECSTIAIDSETTGLNRSTDHVRLIQLGDHNQSFVLPVEAPRSWGGFVLELLDRFEGQIVAHNLSYDAAMIDASLGHQLPVDRSHCTMLMSRVLEPTRSAALKRLASQLVDPRAQVMDGELADAMKGSGYDWRTVPVDFPTYWFYAGVDTVLTYRVHEALRPQLVASDVTRAYDLELAASRVCSRMERHGVKIDVSFARERYQALQDYVAAMADWCQATYGVNPGQNKSVVEVLEDAGHRFIKLTKGGERSLDKEVLSEVDHPLAHAVLKRRQAQKIASTYLRHFIEEVDGDDRLHPNINSCEARTGRMSMSEPNFQQLPRRSESNPLADVVRDCVVPEEGHVLLMCDFSQIEFRLFASLSGDTALREAFQGDDFFLSLARQVFADETMGKSDPRRQTMKNSMYARAYGAGNEKFAWTAGISVDEAKRFNALLDQRQPGIRAFQQHIDHQARARLQSEGVAYVRSPLTNRRFVIDDDKTYKLLNFLLQGSAAEVLKMKLVELAQTGLERYMIIPVHDEIILEVPNDELEEVAYTVHSIMNDDSLFDVPLTAELATGERWGSKIEYQLNGG